LRAATSRSVLASLAALVAVALGLLGAKPRGAPSPPVADVRPHEIESPQGTRNDPYYWLRDDTRSRPDVLDYLQAENAYYRAMTAGRRGLARKLFAEMAGRLAPRDESVPWRDRSYLYFERTEAGREHAVYLRRPVAGGEEQLLVDGNREAAGKDYYSLGGWEVSAKEDLLAFLEDTGGRYQYTLRLRDIATGRDLPERIGGVRPQAAWANDGRTLYYVENDPVTLLSTRVKKHVVGTDPARDPVVYEEKDTSFYLSVAKSGDHRYVLVQLESTVASEWWALDADQPSPEMRCLAPRQRDVRYDPDHVGDRWVIRTDWQAPNYRVMSVEDAEIGDRSRWKEVVPHDPRVFIQEIVVFRDFLAVGERRDGRLGLRVVAGRDPEKGFSVGSDEPASAAVPSHNEMQDTRTLRYTQSSLVTPETEYEVDMETGERRALRTKPVPGYSKEAYVTERVWAPARDGTPIPVSLLYRKGRPRDGTAPLYQYGYGAYGASTDPEFDSTWISLVDRGFVCAIAHVRGGMEMGRAWYDAGRLLRKKNTFTDFVDVTDFLVRERYAAADKAFASGLSAGGLLMGVVATTAGERYRGVVANVPFVDAVTSMLDETIPLTSNEFDEWGSPKDKRYYDYILSYSPYDNVAGQRYPALMVTTSLHDSQVQYFEPAKWVAKLRATRPGPPLLLFRVDMAGAHGGMAGRLESLKQTAEEYAFVLERLGRTD
jgi:oligopeptidase B